MKSSHYIVGVIVSIFLSGCGTGGGSEFGNPTDGTTRVVEGEVDSSGTSGSISKGVGRSSGSSNACVATTIVAENAADEETSDLIDTDCNFAITLPISKAYRFSLEDDAGNVIGTLRFQNNAQLFAEVAMVVTSGSEAISLGRITLSGKTGLPAKQPASQTDQDDDGVLDSDDDDDDNDGTDDTDEADCDLDGFHDDLDTDTDDCAASSTHHVLRVSPPHDALLQLRGRRVQTDEPIRARFSCPLDPDSVTSDTVQIIANNDVVTCVYSVPLLGRRVECEHEEDPMESDTVYTATIDGVRCLNGETVQARSWTWRTRAD